MAVARVPSIRFDGNAVTLGTSQAVIYKIPPSGIGEITGIIVANLTATDKTYNLILIRNGFSFPLSPLDHAIPGGSTWTYEEKEVKHYLRGGEGDTLEGYASSASAVKVLFSMIQKDINARRP